MHSLRRAGLGDLDVVCSKRLAFLAEHRGLHPDELSAAFVERTRAFVERNQRAGTMQTWLAGEGTDCLGVVSLLLLEMPPRPEDRRSTEGYVINMYVERQARGQGIGAALLDECISFARASALRRVFLHATDAGRPLYTSRGFRANDAWMELRLP